MNLAKVKTDVEEELKQDPGQQKVEKGSEPLESEHEPRLPDSRASTTVAGELTQESVTKEEKMENITKIKTRLLRRSCCKTPGQKKEEKGSEPLGSEHEPRLPDSRASTTVAGELSTRVCTRGGEDEETLSRSR